MAMHYRWPASKFYWANLDAAALPKRPTREQLGFLLERYVPERIEALHPVFVHLEGRRYVAVAARKEDLALLPRRASSLRPSSQPSCIEGELDLESIEFLSGEFLPPSARTASRIAYVSPVIAGLAVLGFIALGVLREKGLIRDLAAALNAEAGAATAEALGPTSGSLPPELRLEAALRELRRTRRSPLESEENASPTELLESVMSAWPEGSQIRVENLVATDAGVSLQGVAATAADVQTLGSVIEAELRTRIASPSIRTSPDGFRFELQVPAGAGHPTR